MAKQPQQNKDKDIQAYLTGIQTKKPIEEERQPKPSELLNNKMMVLSTWASSSSSQVSEINDINSKYPTSKIQVQQALQFTESSYNSNPLINNLYNNVHNFYKSTGGGEAILSYAKESAPSNTLVKVFPKASNPYNKNDISNEEFRSLWKTIRQDNPNIKHSDRSIIAALYKSSDDLKRAINMETSSKVTDGQGTLPRDSLLSALNDKLSTKQDLYNFMMQLIYCKTCTRYQKCSHEDYIVKNNNISAQNANQKISDVKVLIVGDQPSIDDIQYKWPFINYNIVQTILQALNVDQTNALYAYVAACRPSDDYINLNASEILSCSQYLEKIIESMNKNSLIVGIGPTAAYRFGITDMNSFYRYNGIMTTIINSEEDLNRLRLYQEGAKITIRRANNMKYSDIVSNLTSSQLTPSTIIPNDEIPTVPTSLLSEEPIKSKRSWSKTYDPNNTNSDVIGFKELEKELRNIGEGYSIPLIGQQVNRYTTKAGEPRVNQHGTPYLVLRKGTDKKLYYIDPEIMIGWSDRNDYLIEENINSGRISTKDNIRLSQLKFAMRDIEAKYPNKQLTWYNTDFSPTIHISSYIKHRLNYKNEVDPPRIVVLDFETDLTAIKVKPDDKTTDAVCRLCSLFDFMEKKFYCIVLKDEKHHKDIDLSDIKSHDGYPVEIIETSNEVDIWKWLNDKLAFLDPDIITGWNVERFDMTYGVIRSSTLGVPLRSKYGLFEIISVGNKSGQSVSKVVADGVNVLDYMVLYKTTQLNRRESYRLDFICDLELGIGKRKLIVEDHDEMYYNYLREYTLYNIEDVERIYDLDNKLNYFKFQYEICGVCNISWHEIFTKSKAIDGLIYNHAWNEDQSLIKEQNYSKDRERSNQQSQAISQIDSFLEDSSVEKSSSEESESSEDSGSGDDGYDGAVVLKPQCGIWEVICDLDASQMYPRLMIRTNIFKDTMASHFASSNMESLAEQWLYNREAFPEIVDVMADNDGTNMIYRMNKEQFANYLNDKIISPYGTIYWKPEVKRSIVSDILIMLIQNRNKYKKLQGEATGNRTKYKDLGDIEQQNYYNSLVDRYRNLQNAYKYLINSFYGVMGLKGYRLFDLLCAATITASGRELTRMVSFYGSKFMEKMAELKTEDVPHDLIPLTEKTLIGMEDIENRPYVLYGDTDSVFLNLGRVVDSLYGNISLDEKIDKAWTLIDKISDYINKYLIKDIMIRKNIDYTDKDQAYNYEFKKELVMSKIMLGTAKKHYATHVIIDGGKRVDEIEVKGMLSKKSDTARFSRDLINKIIDFILTEYDTKNVLASNNKILAIYDEAKLEFDNLIKLGKTDLARPVAVTQEYTRYSTLQAAVKGMLLYDLLYGHTFHPSDKGYHYYINNVNWEKFGYGDPITPLYGKMVELYGQSKWFNTKKINPGNIFQYFDSITIPVELDNLDTENFSINIQKMEKTLLTDKVRELFEIAGIIKEDPSVGSTTPAKAVKRSKKVTQQQANIDMFDVKV